VFLLGLVTTSRWALGTAARTAATLAPGGQQEQQDSASARAA